MKKWLESGLGQANYSCNVTQGPPWLCQGALDVLVVAPGYPGCSRDIIWHHLALLGELTAVEWQFIHPLIN